MLHPFFDVLKVFEQVIDQFVTTKDIKRHLHDPHIDRRAVLPTRAKSLLLGRPRPPAQPNGRGGVFKAKGQPDGVSWGLLQLNLMAENLLIHFQNTEQWMRNENIRQQCAGEVPKTPNSRGGRKIKKRPGKSSLKKQNYIYQ